MLVLIADDNADNRQLLIDIIQSIGHEVVSAFDGPETLALVRDRKPDLVILDVNMPGMSGFEVCNQLKADPETDDIPVVMLTALRADDYKTQGIVSTADDYVSKPFNPRELIARIKLWLEPKEAVDTLSKSDQSQDEPG
ncbi:MAG: response regulator [Anaerolineae bacterium]|nr:response regulator [Anaerolineae bacterium]